MSSYTASYNLAEDIENCSFYLTLRLVLINFVPFAGGGKAVPFPVPFLGGGKAVVFYSVFKKDCFGVYRGGGKVVPFYGAVPFPGPF